MLIPVFNPDTTDLEKSYLSNSYSVGAVLINVKNSDRYAANDRIMIGEMGVEGTEVVTVSGLVGDGNGLNIGATVFSHSADDPVYRLRFDQVKFYRSTTTATGTFTVVSTQNLDVDNATLETYYDDSAGLASYYYKFTFYHSLALVESAFSDVIGGSGWRREQVGNIIDEILQEVGDPNEIHMTRQEVMGYLNDVNDDLQVDVAKPYDFLHARRVIAQAANSNTIDWPTDANGKQIMWAFDYLDYNFLDSTTTPVTNITYTLKTIPEPEFRNIYQDNTISSTTVSDKPSVVCLDSSVKRFRFDVPFATTAGTLYLHYWKCFDVITTEGQVIETPTPKIYKLYVKEMFYSKRAIADLTLQSKAQEYEQKYLREKSKYKGLDRKDKGSPRGFRPDTTRTKQFRRT